MKSIIPLPFLRYRVTLVYSHWRFSPPCSSKARRGEVCAILCSLRGVFLLDHPESLILGEPGLKLIGSQLVRGDWYADGFESVLRGHVV